MPATQLNVDWQAIEKAAILGVTMEELAERHGIGSGTIRKRAWDNQWPIPSKIRKLQQEAGIRVTEGNAGVKAAQIVAESLLERGEKYGRTVFDRVSKLATTALDSLPTPDNWKSFAVADQIVRRAAGLDKPRAEISVNLAMFSQPAGEVKSSWREVESSEMPLDCAESGGEALKE